MTSITSTQPPPKTKAMPSLARPPKAPTEPSLINSKSMMPQSSTSKSSRKKKQLFGTSSDRGNSKPRNNNTTSKEEMDEPTSPEHPQQRPVVFQAFTEEDLSTDFQMSDQPEILASHPFWNTSRDLPPPPLDEDAWSPQLGFSGFGSSSSLLGGYLSANDQQQQQQQQPQQQQQQQQQPTRQHSTASQQSSKGSADMSKSCMPHFRRKSKICSVDVASVGNASDTLISVNNSQQMSGRDLHENAKILFNAGDYERALPLFESILSAQMRRFTPMHASVGAAMHNVGVCRQRMGQDDLAENLFREAVQIRQSTLGRDHLDVAASLSKLGTSLTALSKLEEAYEHLRRALKIAKWNLGREHKTVAQMLCHLGCFYFEAGELFSAQATFEDALEIYRAVWRTEVYRDACMSQLCDTLCNIGSIQNRRKRYTDAVKSFSEALDLQRGIMGHDSTRVISTLDNLGYSYSKAKDYSGALTCYRKMLRAQVSQSGTFTEACFETMQKQVLMLEKSKRFADAVAEVKETLILEKSLLLSNNRDHVLINKTKVLLEECNKKLQRSLERQQQQQQQQQQQSSTD